MYTCTHLYCTTTAGFNSYCGRPVRAEESDDGSYFLDRDGSVFGHVLAYLRDGVVAAGYERDVRMLGRLKREFGFCCVDLLEEHELVLAAGGYDGNGVLRSVAAYDRRTDSWINGVDTDARSATGFRHVHDCWRGLRQWREFNIGPPRDGIGGTIQSAEQHVELGCCDADGNT